MKWIIILTLLSTTQYTFAQSFSFPKLTTQVNSLEKIAPKNWQVIDTVYGDLNGDNQADLAVILEYNTAIAETRAYGNYEIELIKEVQKPRVLAIYFKGKLKNYTLAVQNNDFILRAEEGGKMGDPYKGISISNNSLYIAFEGGYDWRWKLNYTFNYNAKTWKLIAANNLYYNKDSGEMIDKRYDFNNRTLTSVIGNIFNRKASNFVDEDILIFGEQRNLSNFKKPWTWEISKDNYL